MRENLSTLIDGCARIRSSFVHMVNQGPLICFGIVTFGRAQARTAVEAAHGIYKATYIYKNCCDGCEVSTNSPRIVYFCYSAVAQAILLVT